MSDHSEELLALVEDAADDIIFDHVNYDRPRQVEIKSKEVQCWESGEDDGSVYGKFRIDVNGGKFIIELEASAVFQGFQDCWDWGTESHYTKDVYFDELQDFEYKITAFAELGETHVDRVIETSIDAAREEKS